MVKTKCFLIKSSRRWWQKFLFTTSTSSCWQCGE